MTAVRWQTTLNNDASTDDTLAAIVATVNVYSTSPFSQAAVEIIKRHCGPTNLDFIKCLFDWSCRNLTYKLDPLGNEIIRTPDLSVRLKHADCKKFSILLGSILKAAGIEPVFKHVTYADEPDYTHIYTLVAKVILDGGSFHPHAENFVNREDYIVLDPTNNCRYDSEVSYSTATIYFLNGQYMKLTMMGKVGLNAHQALPGNWGQQVGHCSDDVLNTMRGIGGKLPSLNTIWKDLKGKPLLPLPPTFSHAHVMQNVLKVTPGSKLHDTLVNIPIEQQRGAFLQIMKNNYGGAATHALAVLSKNPAAFNELWHNLGGDISELKSTILEGSKAAEIPIVESEVTLTPEEKAGKPLLAGATVSGNFNTIYSGVGVTKDLCYDASMKLIPCPGTHATADMYSPAPHYMGKGISFGSILKGVLHAGAAILHAVAPVANAIFPGSGAAINKVADTANNIANQIPAPGPGSPPPPPNLLPADKGVKVPINVKGGDLTGTPISFVLWAFMDTMILEHNHYLLQHFTAPFMGLVGLGVAAIGAITVKLLK
jgi:hypothetical protein